MTLSCPICLMSAEWLTLPLLDSHIYHNHNHVEVSQALTRLIAQEGKIKDYDKHAAKTLKDAFDKIDTEYVKKERIEQLIDKLMITTLIPSKPLELTEACDMVRDWFIKELEDLLK